MKQHDRCQHTLNRRLKGFWVMEDSQLLAAMDVIIFHRPPAVKESLPFLDPPGFGTAQEILNLADLADRMIFQTIQALEGEIRDDVRELLGQEAFYARTAVLHNKALRMTLLGVWLRNRAVCLRAASLIAGDAGRPTNPSLPVHELIQQLGIGIKPVENPSRQMVEPSMLAAGMFHDLSQLLRALLIQRARVLRVEYALASDPGDIETGMVHMLLALRFIADPNLRSMVETLWDGIEQLHQMTCEHVFAATLTTP